MDIEKILSQMTLADKIALCEGANFWETRAFEKYGIPSIFVCDGPNGLRKQETAGATDWGFDGMVVTDWGAMNDRIQGFKAGCDLNMPGGSDYMFKQCAQAAQAGDLSGQDIDNSVRRILKLVARGVQTEKKPYTCDYTAHHAVARRAAEAGGEAVANLLYGRVNPSGKLAESWPVSYETVPSADLYGKTNDALYMESIYVGYRYYDKAEVPVRWPFGHGLSYTTFGYSDLTVAGQTVSVTVTNTGNRPGAEVAQLYIAAPQDGIHRPVRELKAFQKVFLQPGESKRISFTLNQRSFAIWSNGWKVPGGIYAAQIADLSANMEILGETVAIPAWQAGSWYENCKGTPGQRDWQTLIGSAYVPPVLKKGSFTMDNTVMEMKDYSLVMKIMYKATEMVIAKGCGGKADYENPEFRMMMNAAAGGPLRSMQISGGIKGGIIPGMLEMANGHFFRGIWKMIRG